MKFYFRTLGQLLISALILTTSAFAADTVKPFTLVVLGDSLTEGYGIPKEQAFPALLESKFHEAGASQVKVINAGISGSTSSSAVSRLDWILKTKPDVIMLALGANDGLRGISTDVLKQNLKSALDKIKSSGAQAILVGMKMPPNYGKAYSASFEKAYSDLASSEKVKLIPFLLEGTAGNKELTQPDGLHPNEKGHIVIASYVFNNLGELREKLIHSNPPKKKLLNPNERRPRNG